MPLTDEQNEKIKNIAKTILDIDNKIQKNRDAIEQGDASPFFKALFGKKRTLFVKVGQSIQTTFGMSFYEQTCKILGEEIGYKVELQKKALGFIPVDVEKYLQNLNKTNYVPNRQNELIEIRNLCKKYNKNSVKNTVTEYRDSIVDVYIKTNTGKEILIDITTVKPSKKEIRVLKEKTLRWASYRLSQNPKLDIETYFAIPYNPEGSTISDTKYKRLSKYYDRDDILVGDELWKKVSNDNCSIEDIANIFISLGGEMEIKINNSFAKINQNKCVLFRLFGR